MKNNLRRLAVLLLAAAPVILSACGSKTADTPSNGNAAVQQEESVLGHHDHDMHVNDEYSAIYNQAIDYVETTLDTSVYSKTALPGDGKMDALYTFETSAEKNYVAIDFPDVLLDGKAGINIGTPVSSLLDAGFEESGKFRAIRAHKGLNIYISDNTSRKQEVFVWNDTDSETVSKNCVLSNFTFKEKEKETMIPFDCNGITIESDFAQVIKSLGIPKELRVNRNNGNIHCLYQSKQNSNWEISVDLHFDSNANTAKLSQLRYNDTLN